MSICEGCPKEYLCARSTVECHKVAKKLGPLWRVPLAARK